MKSLKIWGKNADILLENWEEEVKSFWEGRSLLFLRRFQFSWEIERKLVLNTFPCEDTTVKICLKDIRFFKLKFCCKQATQMTHEKSHRDFPHENHSPNATCKILTIKILLTKRKKSKN